MLPVGNDLEILQLLVRGPMYGGQMVEKSGKLKRGSIYTVLERLERKNFVKSWIPTEQPAGVRGTPRRMYKLTGEGARAMEASRAAGAIWKGALVPIGGSRT